VFQSTAAFPKLRALLTEGSNVTEEGAAALAVVPWNLCDLRLRRCNLGDSGLLALAQGNMLRGLTKLDLSGNPISGEGILMFADAAMGKCKSMEELNVPRVRDPAAAKRVLLMAFRAD
jgi:Leucine Rich repeat